MESIILIIIIFALIVYYNNIPNTTTIEKFNDQSGKLCYTCNGKTINQCQSCFNCGFCVDRWGNSQCLAGTVNGPYNNEDCALWYYGDPWSRMLQNNKSYKCSYGPKAGNREVGIYSCDDPKRSP